MRSPSPKSVEVCYLVARPARHQDGYRYVRAYRPPTAPYPAPWRYAAWERQNGRMRRVGTLTTNEQVASFLLHLHQDREAIP